ncbi:MAG TPA: hypothetical protein VM055_00455 [Novosphingobium sp.]|nr:hypothetical protein [Novosphingobium sp.]
MPHARAEPEPTRQDRYAELFDEWSRWAGEQATRLSRFAGDEGSRLARQGSSLAKQAKRRARENPRAAAALAAGVLGLVAAAFIPALRRRRSAFG